MSKETGSYYHGTGPDTIAIGDIMDRETAQLIAGPGSWVYAAIRPSAKAIHTVAYAGLKTAAIIPCLWPHLLFGGPFLYATGKNRAAALSNTLYIITNDRMIISVTDHSAPCSYCVSSGSDSGEFQLENIIEVAVDNRGKGYNWWKTASVRISLSTREYFLLVENPAEIAAVIRDLRRLKSDQKNSPVIFQQPTQIAPLLDQTKIICVAMDENPGLFKTVNLLGKTESDWETFQSDIRQKFSLAEDCHLKFELAEIQTSIASAAELGANDKLVVSIVKE